jgi:transposase
MGQRTKILTQILGFYGWKVAEHYFEAQDGHRVLPVRDYLLPARVRVVLRVERRFLRGRCCRCGAICARSYAGSRARRWHDLPWAGHPVLIEYAPERVRCRRCRGKPLEALPWADPYQRETRRLQQHIALQSASMPILRVAAQFGLSWSTVRRAEDAAIARWEAKRPKLDLREVGVDEKYLGRRHKRTEKYVTIVSNLATGEPVWMGYGRDKATLTKWLDTLTLEQKMQIRLFAMDMHDPFKAAVEDDPVLGHLGHVPIVHDPFHVMKRANKAVDELRRSVFFRAGPDMRAVGRGTRWLFLRAWERCSDNQQADLRSLLAYNSRLANAYQVKEELRAVLRAPDEQAMAVGMAHIFRRTQRKSNIHLRALHDSLRVHFPEILALAKYRPPVGRIEALNNNWETLVRIGRGYRNHHYLLRKLRFVTAAQLQSEDGVREFLSLAEIHPLFPRAAQALAA